jgi:SNF2 family DNA or RNA helicase
LALGNKAHRERMLTLDRIIDPDYQPRSMQLALPAREYQARAAEMYLSQGFLLLGDDVGIGKTVSAIASFCDQRTLPACVVTLAHLPRQWAKEVGRFAPDLFVHVVKNGQAYELPKQNGRGPDVLIVNYHKLAGWADVLAKYCRSVVFDEIQELRHSGSGKYCGAKHVAGAARFAIGLSATPIYNYGGEIFNVLEVLRSGLLGNHSEFAREWCEGRDDKLRLKNPVGFGSYLREQHIMLRRTRSDVGRELPPLQRIVQEVDCDAKVFAEIGDAASELARIILAQSGQVRGEKMRAAEEFNNLMRQATGIAKAPYVAAFVRLLIENGERVVLYGWHRAVYEIWRTKLADLNPAIYTGSESPSKKDAERQRFAARETPLLIISLRSGAGLDGLQFACRTVVFGELDWSPGVHEQCIGRVYRDGQPDPVAAYFLLAEDGADPIMSETLGLKREQIEGLRDMATDGIERLDYGGAALRAMAQSYLARLHRRNLS